MMHIGCLILNGQKENSDKLLLLKAGKTEEKRGVKRHLTEFIQS
jgi:hypothetical protein